MSSMGQTRSRPRKTLEDFMALPDDTRAELIRGELYMPPSPRPGHQDVLFALGRLVADAAEALHLGKVYIAPLDVHLPSEDIVEPDLIFVSTANRSIIQDWIRGVPDLLIEIVSPSHPERDRIVKRDLYEENAVPEYWIVDTEAPAIEVLRFEDGAYAPAGYFQAGSRLRTRTLPGLEIPIDDVFASP